MSAIIITLPVIRLERDPAGGIEPLVGFRVRTYPRIFDELAERAEAGNMPPEDLAEALIVKGLAELAGKTVVKFLADLKVEIR